MKITVDFLSKKVVTDKETTFFQSENLANKISVYVANVSATYYLSIEFLLPNGRKTSIQTRDAFADGEANTYSVNGVSYDIHNFTLNDTIMSVPGMLAFTVYINFTNTDGAVTSRGVLVNGVNMVVKTTGYSNDTILVVGDDPSSTISDMQDAISTLNGLLASKADLNGNATKDFNALTIKSTTDKTQTFNIVDSSGDVICTISSYLVGSTRHTKITPKTGTNLLVDGKLACANIINPDTTYDNGRIGTQNEPFGKIFVKNLEFSSLNSIIDDSMLLGAVRESGVDYLKLYKSFIPNTSSGSYAQTIGTSDIPFSKGYFTYVYCDVVGTDSAIYTPTICDKYNTTCVYLSDDGDGDMYINANSSIDIKAPTINFRDEDNDRCFSLDEYEVYFYSNVTFSNLRNSVVYFNGDVYFDQIPTINDVNVATETYVNNAIANLIGIGTPAQFDTLKEIADWIATHGTAYSSLVTAVNGKADASSVYTKSATDSLLDAKANASTTYTKNEVDAMFVGDTASLFAELEGVWA